MRPPSQQQFIEYLQGDLEISDEAINLALRCQDSSQGQLHMILWQHGLLDLEQLDQALEWQVDKTVDSSAGDS